MALFGFDQEFLIGHGLVEGFAQDRDRRRRNFRRHGIRPAEFLSGEDQINRRAVVVVFGVVVDPVHVGQFGMLGQAELNEHRDLFVLYPLTLGRLEAGPGDADVAGHLVPLHGEEAFFGARIARHHLELGTQDSVGEQRVLVGRAARARDHQLIFERVIKGFERAVRPGDADVVFTQGAADPLQLAWIELGAVGMEHRIGRYLRIERTDLGAILGADVIDVVGGDQRSRPVHILDDKRRLTGNMVADVGRDRAREGIVAAADRTADDNADLFALEVILAIARRSREQP